MAGSLQGAAQYKARVNAVKHTFDPYGRKWAEAATKHAKAGAQFKNRTGKGRRSIRVKAATPKGAAIVANAYVAILDTGSKAHTIEPKRADFLVFQAGGRTVFSRKVHKPAMKGLGFAKRAAVAASREVSMEDELVKRWNGAA